MAKPGRRVPYDLPSSAVPFETANDLESLLVPAPSRRWNPSAIRSPLLEVEDRRTFHPLDDLRPVASLRRWNVRSVAKPLKAKATPKVSSGRTRAWKFSFAAPEHVLVCMRRGRRKEVLHALKKTGKGSGRSKRRRNSLSNVRC